MKTAGVVFDFYDDAGGTLLKKTFPTADSLPDIVKTAHILSPEERGVLRDEAYALILHNEGKLLRKYACVDEGNTLLSCLYFERNADLLPTAAVKTAAANLAAFCEEFNLEPTPFIKAAARAAKDNDDAAKSGMGRTRDPMRQPMVGDEADWSARTNLVSVRGGADSGRVIPSANQMKTANAVLGYGGGSTPAPSTVPAAGSPMAGKKPMGNMPGPMAMPKMGSADMPGGKISDDKRAVGVNQKNPPQQNHKKTPDKNTFAVGPGQGDLDVNYKETQWPKVANMVDVSGEQGTLIIKRKTASTHALGNKYPLDSYADVKTAVSYFENNWVDMTPEDRHEYCVKTAARANDLGITTSELMDRYGSETYAADIEAHLASRKANSSEDIRPIFDTLKEKRSSIDPEDFVQLLKQADEEANLIWHYGGEIADPYMATFGPSVEKLAEADWSWKSRTGDFVTLRELTKLSIDGKGMLKKYFSHDMCDAFMLDPVGIFESMPETQKTILCHLANGEFDAMPTN